MIKNIYGSPRYEVEFKNGEILPFPNGYNDHRVKAVTVDNTVVLTHPAHPPVALKKNGWVEIHPDLTTTQKNFIFPRANGRNEVYGDMSGPFKTVVWFALGNNPNNPKDTKWARP